MATTLSVSMLLAMTVLTFHIGNAGATHAANAFLGLDIGATMTSPRFEEALLSEVEETLGMEWRLAYEGRLSDIEEALRSTFNSLPKNVHGHLSPAAARHALHRLFVARHGWFLEGMHTLDAGSAEWNASSHVTILEQASSPLQQLFSMQLGRDGFSLKDITVLAGVIEHLTHNEAAGQLKAAYALHGLSTDDQVPIAEVQQLMETYMSSHILGTNLTSMTPEKLKKQQKMLPQVYPNWPETAAFMQKLQREKFESSEVNFAQVSDLMVEANRQYSHHQDLECQTLRQQLIALEYRGTGRVLLADFYGSALNDGQWQFSENSDYLRQLGALDESDVNRPSVIIANYVGGVSNCLASSKYYSVCCMNPCEGLFGEIEQQLNSPSATPEKIAAIVSALPSATVPGNRTLTPILVQRLHEIASTHGGEVPLQSRLFAQWMHHAYPRECPYPHLSGSTFPRKPEEYQKETGVETGATEEEMRQFYENSKKLHRAASSEDPLDECTPWSHDEELIAPVHSSPRKPTWQHQSTVSQFMSVASFLAALVSAATVVLKMVGSTADAVGVRPTKHVV